MQSKFVLVVPLSHDLKKVVAREQLGEGPAFIAGKVHYPGTLIQPGEAEAVAAARALKAETGLEVQPLELKHIAYRAKKGEYELTVFAARIDSLVHVASNAGEVTLVQDVEAVLADASAHPDWYEGEIIPLLRLARMQFHEQPEMA
ncbi:NUDIX domain-containing protein [Burkholderia multivorans]|jgi:ADP-ribose pyrophosphatase YjhB (NUDIX family)|uniref:NUDIX domain-containing protein n=1 Tax=Burkholderia multivorans TaxID=87883 RepID=UPI001C2119D6|nr:NUDIX domain-containing protein [Burkholderia multivorans]MBU9200145.1 NUDIX domain-containing protein [Burkholderia multivorans]MDN8078734.1 NUDIX domain-containing protein [Burkholderia multivorans]